MINIKGLKVFQEDIPHTITGSLGSMNSLSWCQIHPLPSAASQKSRFIRSGYIFPVFSLPVLVSLCPLKPWIAVFGWQKWNRMWSSVLAQPPCTLKCGASWDAFLITTLKIGWLSYYSLSVRSNQSIHSPLTSHQEGVPVHRSAAHWMLFLFRAPFWVKTHDCWEWKSQQTSPEKQGFKSIFYIDHGIILTSEEPFWQNIFAI